jgi:hypothetical protein
VLQQMHKKPREVTVYVALFIGALLSRNCTQQLVVCISSFLDTSHGPDQCGKGVRDSAFSSLGNDASHDSG